MPPSTRAAAPLAGTTDQIAARIRSDIEEGVFAPGEALNQVSLAGSFGLSRIPIREALRQLEADGYVTYRPNKGAIVTRATSPATILEIIEIRECLELRLMGFAVENMNSDLIREAEATLSQLNRARSPEELRGSHERFHTILFRAAQRPLMASTINVWRFRLDERPDADGKKKRAFVRAVAGIHKRLLAGCVQRDADVVERCVSEEYRYLRSIAPRLS